MHQRAEPVAREGFVGTGAGRLFVRDIGTGRPMVIVHGGPDFDHEYLVPEMDLLADSFRLVYYDQRGRGRSFSGQRADDITMASEVGDLDRVRDWSGAGSVAVLGHSWGSVLAMEYAIRHPQRVSHLILMNSAPASHADSLTLREELARRRTPEETSRMKELRSDPRFQAGDVELEAEYYRIHYGTTLQDRHLLDAVVARLRSRFTIDGILLAREIEDRLYAETWSRGDYDMLPALRKLDIPTLIIHGDNDFVPLDLVRHIADAVSGTHLVILPDCGHFAYLDQPDRVWASVARFMTDP